MSSSQKSDTPNFDDVDYGELGDEYRQYNDIFKGLDIETKKKLFRDFPNNKNTHIGILKNISDPQIQRLWSSLSESEKEKLNSKNIQTKYVMLREMLNKKKQAPKMPSSSSSSSSSEQPKSSEESPPSWSKMRPKSPEESPPPLTKPPSPEDSPPSFPLSLRLQEFEKKLDSDSKKQLDLIKDPNERQEQLMQKFKVYENLEDFGTIMRGLRDPDIIKIQQGLSSSEKARIGALGDKEQLQFLRNRLYDDLLFKRHIIPKSPQYTPPEMPELLKDVPQDMFQDENVEIPKEKVKEPPQKQFDNIVKKFYNMNPYVFSIQSMYELEVKFGTKGIKPLTRND